MSATGTASGPRHRLLFSIVTLVLILGGIEVGQRISDARIRARRPPKEQTAYEARLVTTRGAELSQKRGGLVYVLDRAVLYRLKPDQRVEAAITDGRIARITVGPSGFRGREPAPEKGRDLYRVALLGGSTAFGWDALSDDATPAAALERRLAERLAADGGAPARVEVLNAALSGYDSGLELAMLTSRVLAFEPDAVVTLDGWNDIHESMGGAPVDGGYHWAVYELEEAMLAKRSPWAELLRSSAFYRGLERKAQRWRQERARESAPWGAGPPEGWLPIFTGIYRTHEDPAMPARYRRNVGLIARIARASGADAVLALQPELLHRSGPIPEAEERLRRRLIPPYVDVVTRYYPKLAEAAADAARVEGAVFVDGRTAFDGRPEAYFTDPVHLTEAGADVVSARIADALAPLARRKLAARR
jgi:lysophospholipase L1-like esterase